jgi:hypothetical protein
MTSETPDEANKQSDGQMNYFDLIPLARWRKIITLLKSPNFWAENVNFRPT